MASSDNQFDKPQRERPKRADLLDVNINTGTQSINTERASLMQVITTTGARGSKAFVSPTGTWTFPSQGFWTSKLLCFSRQHQTIHTLLATQRATRTLNWNTRKTKLVNHLQIKLVNLYSKRYGYNKKCPMTVLLQNVENCWSNFPWHSSDKYWKYLSGCINLSNY